jgi:hypothetical protein
VVSIFNTTIIKVRKINIHSQKTPNTTKKLKQLATSSKSEATMKRNPSNFTSPKALYKLNIYVTTKPRTLEAMTTKSIASVSG